MMLTAVRLARIRTYFARSLSRMVGRNSARLWLVLSRFGHGGLERVQVALANGLHGRGHEAMLVAGQVHVRAVEGLAEDIPVLEIAPHGALHFLLGFCRAWRRQKPQIIFTTSNDVACLVLLLTRLSAEPARVVVTQHLSVSGPRMASRGARRLKLELLRMAMRLLFPWADARIAVSQAVANDLCAELKLSPGQVGVIHNPVVTPESELRSLQPVSWPWPDDGVPTVVFVGRFSPEKRLDLLIRVFSDVVKRRTARLLLIGAGPLERQVLAWMEDAALGASCEWIGYVDNPLPYVRRSNVLVLCSDYEGFGNVLVEAMACGTQVVSTDCRDGPREILQDGQYGQLVRCGDAEALADALINAIDGRHWVEPDRLRRRASDFGVQQSVDAYAELVENLLRTPVRPRRAGA